MRRAFGLLVVACISATAAVVPTVASATTPIVYAMVIGATPFALFSEAPAGITGQEVTITLPIGEAPPLIDEFNAFKGGNVNAKFAKVDIYVSTGGSGTDFRLTDVFVNSLSLGTYADPTVTATLASATPVAAQCLNATDATCAPAGLPKLSLASLTNPSDLAQTTTFTASRPRYPGGPADSGTVAFSADGTLIAGCGTVAMSSGQAMCTTSFFASGAHTITATDSGDTYYLQDSATYTQNVNTTGQFLVSVSGSQIAGSTSPSFVADDTPPPDITVNGSVVCTGVFGAAIDSTLAAGTYIIAANTCSGLSLSGTNASAYTIAYLGGQFTVTPVSITPVTVTITGSQDVGSSTPSFIPSSSPPSGITVNGSVSCSGLTGSVPIGPGLGAGSYTIDPTTCSGLSLSGSAALSYVLTYIGGAFTVNDRTAPTVTLTGTPTDPSSNTSPAFTFSMSDADNTSGLSAFCSFDGAPFAACSSPAAPGSPLVPGLHTFAVHATDPSGNQSTDIGFIWNVGSGAPSSITLNVNGVNNFAMLTAAFGGTPTGGVTLTATIGAVVSSPLLHDLFTRATKFNAELTLSAGGRIAHVHLSNARLVRFDTPLQGGTATLEILFESWTVTFTNDTTAPTVTLTSTPTNPSNNNQPSIGFTVADPDDTVGLMAFCSFDSAAFTPCVSPATPASPLTDGSHTFAVRATDPAGNQGADVSFSWLVDTTPGLITATAMNADGSPYLSNTWTHQAVTVSFACTDPGGSGVSSVSPPITLQADGANQSVSGTCTDAAGNNSSVAFGGIDIDQTPPVLTVRHIVDGANGSNVHAPVLVTITTSDATSGIAGLPTCSDSLAPALAVTSFGTSYAVSVTGDGVHVVTCSVADLAGNTTSATDTVRIDVTPPSITIVHTADGNVGWNIHSPVALTVTASDATSGLAGPPTCIDSQGGPLAVTGSGATYTASVDGEGVHVVTCTITDIAGNTSSATDTVLIDTKAPSISVTHTADGNGSWNIHSPSAATITASDATSGIAGPPTCSDSLAGALAVTGSTVSITGDGVHVITCSIADVAGNTASATDTVRIDATGPSISVTHTADGTGGWNVHSPVALIITATGSVSGLTGTPACTDSLNGGAPIPMTVGGLGPAFSASAADEGTHAINCVATSVSGVNRSASDTVRIDTVAPVVVYTGNAGSYTVDQMVAMTCSATDPAPGSGIAQSTCAPISGPAYLFGLGSHTFNATATDNAGNAGHGTTTFIVTVTQPSLCNLTLSFIEGSARYKSLPANVQTFINQLAYSACLHLLKASQEPLDDDSDRELTAYQSLVNILTAFGFLTSSQAATLINLSHALD